MKVIVFGATGMVGQGVVRECLLDGDVEEVLVVGRTKTGLTHGKVREIVHADMHDLAPIADRLAGYDACFFCLGVSAFRMTEADYRRMTYDLTLAAARILAERSPAMTFIYVSGAGTDSTEKGGAMWARVKGATENALFALPFARTIMLRPGFIQPMHGIRSKTPLYRAVYAVFSPLYPVFKAIAPKAVTNTEQVGRAMLEVAKRGAPKKILENRDIHAIASASAGAVAHA